MIKSSFLLNPDKYTNSITMKQSDFVIVLAQIGFILKKSFKVTHAQNAPGPRSN